MADQSSGRPVTGRAGGREARDPADRPGRKHRPGQSDTLRKVYVEPTNACNLACATCVRHAWDEPEGSMAITWGNLKIN